MYGLGAAALWRSICASNGATMPLMAENTTATMAAAEGANLSSDSLNGTINPFAHSSLLATLIPEYSLLAGVVRNTLGLDIGLIMTTSLVLYSLSTSLQYLWSTARSFVAQHYTAAITIRDHDEIYNHVMSWLDSQRLTTQNTHLTAETNYNVDPDEEPEMKGGFVNFATYFGRSAPRYAPAPGQHFFRHRGRFFELSRLSSEGMADQTPKETLVISCIGRSTQPIKTLLADCKDAYYAKKVTNTNISRPMSSGGGMWDLVTSRRTRPIETVVLDATQKEGLLEDMNEFLRPATATWYAERGIPYRRGYLFHGPPGTGKTSLSFALAGVFGLDIFCLSLMDSNMDEETLLCLFAQLPSRCVVLLEDVDIAGLAKRKGLEGEDQKGQKSRHDADSSGEHDSDIDVIAHDAPKQHSSISLSGLLNAIDGVASHEGRVLVLTTNKASALDAALCRPGRVDREVAFRLADRTQIADLFGRMYIGNADATSELAQAFAAQFQDAVWSPAEIQGFLLMHKKEPLIAVKQVGVWRDEQLEKKGKKDGPRTTHETSKEKKLEVTKDIQPL